MANLLIRANSYLALDPRPRLGLYALSAPALLLGSLSTHVWSNNFLVIASYSLANVLSLLVTGVVFLVLRRFVGSSRKTVLLQISIFGAVLGGVKGATTALFAVALGVETGIDIALLARIVTPVIGMGLSLTLAFAQAALRDIDQTRALLRNEGARLTSGTAITPPQFNRLLSEVADLQIVGPVSPSQFSDLILKLVNRELRPLSKSLMRARRVSGSDLSQLVELGSSTRFTPFATAILFATNFLTPLAARGLQAIILGFLVALGSSWAVLQLGNWLHGKTGGHRSLRTLLLTGVTVLNGFGIVSLLEALGLTNWPVWWLATITCSLWFAVIIVTVGVARVVLSERAKLKEQVRHLMRIAPARSNQGFETALHRRQLANHLHSHVQNRLLSQAIRIQEADSLDLDRELQILKAAVSAPLPKFAAFSQGLDEVAARWEGILKISFHVTVEPKGEILPAIEEAITNAHRHGKASEIEVSVSSSSLSVIDNGLGPRNGLAGIGSRYFSQIGDWSLTAGENGGSLLQIWFHSEH